MFCVQVEDPKLIVSFHLMGQLSPLNNVMENPLGTLLNYIFNVDPRQTKVNLIYVYNYNPCN